MSGQAATDDDDQVNEDQANNNEDVEDKEFLEIIVKSKISDVECGAANVCNAELKPDLNKVGSGTQPDQAADTFINARNPVKLLPDVLEFFGDTVVSPMDTPGYSGKFDLVQWLSPGHDDVPVFKPEVVKDPLKFDLD